MAKVIKCVFCGSKEVQITTGFAHGINLKCYGCDKRFSLKEKVK